MDCQTIASNFKYDSPWFCDPDSLTSAIDHVKSTITPALDACQGAATSLMEHLREFSQISVNVSRIPECQTVFADYITPSTSMLNCTSDLNAIADSIQGFIKSAQKATNLFQDHAPDSIVFNSCRTALYKVVCELNDIKQIFCKLTPSKCSFLMLPPPQRKGYGTEFIICLLAGAIIAVCLKKNHLRMRRTLENKEKLA